MRDKHLYKSPAIEVYGNCRLLLSWLGVSCWFFCNPGVKNFWDGPRIEPTTLDLSSQFSVRGLWTLAATKSFIFIFQTFISILTLFDNVAYFMHLFIKVQTNYFIKDVFVSIKTKSCFFFHAFFVITHIWHAFHVGRSYRWWTKAMEKCWAKEP